MSNEIVISSSTEKESEFVQDSLVKYNAQQVAFTQAGIFEHINFVAKNDKHDVIGGINAMLYCWRMLYIDILWVDESYRSKGIGSQLMNKVQTVAKEKGCSLIHLDTFDFQAKDFYLKNGFEVFGILEDCPPGHSRFYMKKRL